MRTSFSMFYSPSCSWTTSSVSCFSWLQRESKRSGSSYETTH